MLQQLLALLLTTVGLTRSYVFPHVFQSVFPAAAAQLHPGAGAPLAESSHRGTDHRRHRIRQCAVPALRAGATDSSTPDSSNSGGPFEDLKVKLRGTCVYFVGMMGSGKSTLGNAFANKMGYRFLDTDEIAEFMVEMPISEYFAQGKVDEFRELEYQVRGCVVCLDGSVAERGREWVRACVRACLHHRARRVRGPAHARLRAGRFAHTPPHPRFSFTRACLCLRLRGADFDGAGAVHARGGGHRRGHRHEGASVPACLATGARGHCVC